MARRSDRTAGVEAEEVARPFLPWLGRACRQAREERGVVQVKIAAAIEVNQATIARFEDGSAWPRKPEEVLMAYATELDIDMRLLWVQALVHVVRARAGLGRRQPGADPGGARAAGDLTEARLAAPVAYFEICTLMCFASPLT